MIREPSPSATLQAGREKLISSLIRGTAEDFLEKHTALLDDYFQESFARSSVGPGLRMEENPCAFLALGGYGRREQCLRSDVDILIVFKKRIPEEANGLVQEIVYPLWDRGLEVGHSTRTLKECLRLASEDFEVMTSLLDARFLCGFSPLTSELSQAVVGKLLARNSGAFLQWLVAKNRERHESFGDSSYLLEPNLKEGQGGLRDYHAIGWMALARYQLRTLAELLRLGHVTRDEARGLEEALSFVWKVRNHLHRLAGRKCDQLYFEHQVEAARLLGYRDGNGRQGVELFLGALHGHMDFIKQLHLTFVSKVLPRKSLSLFGSGPALRLRTRGIRMVDGALDFQTPSSVLENPHLLIKIFEQSALLGVPLSIEAKRLVRERLSLVDEDFRSSRPTVQCLRRIMTAPNRPFSVLKEMFGTGLLVSLVPETRGIVNLIQYDDYHVYPVDLHTLRTVQILKDFGRPDPETRGSLPGELYRDLADPEPLVWAAFFHDVGKGVPSEDHSAQGAAIARGVLGRMALPPETADLVAFLVREHLLLMKTATRRDLQDEKTVIQVARKFRTLDELKMLYLLTVADTRATGPKAWNTWIDTLLRELFFKTRHLLEKGDLAATGAAELVEKKKQEVLRKAFQIPAADLNSLFEKMSPRYLLHTAPADILRHIGLFPQLERLPFVIDAQKGEADYRTLTVCARDRPGLFSGISGALTLNNLNILNANIYTWGNQVALDIFRVTSPPDALHEEETWDRVRRDLQAALEGRLDLEAALAQKLPAYRPARPPSQTRPDRIVVDNRASDFFTVIEVYTRDFPGLLYKLTRALFLCGLDVRVAKIATQVDQVLDVFYVRDFEGQKVDDPARVESIRGSLEEAVAGAHQEANRVRSES